MTFRPFALFIFCISFCFSTLFAQDCSVHQIKIGPEIYHVNRKRESVSQNGAGVGLRATYDRIKANRIYWGGQLFYGRSYLWGNADDDKIHSHLTDFQIEGSLGFNYQPKKWPWIIFTPFAGYGYFREINKFQHPSLLHVKFSIKSRYFTYGFISHFTITPSWDLGLNFRIRYPWEPRCHVSDDPKRDSVNQHIKERLFYRVELPLCYQGKTLWRNIQGGVMPFYEIRRYGKRENFPFDFYETKLHIYGGMLFLWYQF